MADSTYDWSCFDLKIPIQAKLPKVAAGLFSQEGLERWFLRSSPFFDREGRVRLPTEALQKGDSYLWHWFGYPDSVFEKGIILEANGQDLLAFTFGGDPHSPMRVSIALNELGEGTMVTLKQENISLDEDSKAKFHLGCMQGWTFYLANLKSLMEGGVDLRNKDINLQQVLNS